MRVEQMCDCEPMPVNYWRLPDGSWLAATQLSEASDPDADADRYHALGCTAWVIACPQCGRRYLAGTTPPGTGVPPT